MEVGQEFTVEPKALPDLGTVEGAKEYLYSLFPLIRENFETDGLVQPIHFLFVTVNPNTGQPLDHTGVLLVGNEDAMANDASKNQFAAILKELVKTTHSVGIIQVMEVWTIKAKPGEGMSPKEYERLRKKGVSIQDMPGAYEAVTVMMEHRRAKGPYLYVAEISRDSSGKGTLQPFEVVQNPETSESGSAVGRFAGYFQHLS